jgi:HD-like signal output (HDOD) protein
MRNIRKLISGKIRLPFPPAIAIKNLELVRKDDISSEEMAKIVEADPAPAEKILKLTKSVKGR